MIHLRLLGTVDLRDDAGGQLRRVLAQPKRVALLAYLALGNGETRQRDTILALFWPELDTARARAALRQALHHLRHELGEGAITTEGEGLAIDPAVVRCDACLVTLHAAAADDAATVAEYGGALLDGVHVSDASVDWESWLDAERSRLRDTALQAAGRLISAARAANDLEGAVVHARRASQLAPEDDTMARALVTSLAALGDKAGAIRARDAFAKRLRREYELDVSPEMEALVATIRGDGRPRLSPSTSAIAQGAADWAQAAVGTLERPRHRARWGAIAGAALGVLAIIAASTAWRARHSEPTVLAVGLIRDHTGSPDLAAAVAELLATDLARAAGSRVISTPRMYELMALMDSSVGERQKMSRAARSAGAEEFLEGALYRDSTGLRLDLERVNLATGRAINARTITGADAFALAERATSIVLGTMRVERASGNLRDVVSQSPMALRFYQEGMRARAQGDRAAARRFFAMAVAEDSSFAMATFELAMFEPQVGPLHLRALRLAAATSDRERLTIQTTLAHLLDDPSTRAFAETLAVRYPLEPEGPMLFGRALIAEGRFADAIAPLRQVIVMDSAGLRIQESCRACDAYAEIISAYTFMDSLPAAERVAREFVRTRPTRAYSSMLLVNVLEYEQRYDEARSLLGQVEDAASAPLGEYSHRADLLIREGRLGEAEAYLQRIIAATTGDDRANAQWSYTILLRTQGRYREALTVADLLRARSSAPPAPAAAKYWSAGMRAMILFDMGRYAEVVALRDSARRVPFGFTQPRQARSAIGELANIATAKAAQGDTAGLRVIAAEVERLGRLTGYAIPRQMYHYVRGLRLGVLGQHREAVRELRLSIYSPNAGFVRASYELGKELIAAGQPREARAVLTSALRGPIGAGGLSVTRPSIEMLLAKANELSGDTAAAVAGYSRAVSAWEHGDSYVTAARAQGVARLRALQR